MSLNSRMYRFIGSLRCMSISRSSLHMESTMDRKHKLLEKIKEKTENSNISNQIKKKTNHGEGQDTGIQINRNFNIDIDIAFFKKSILILLKQYIARN